MKIVIALLLLGFLFVASPVLASECEVCHDPIQSNWSPEMVDYFVGAQDLDGELSTRTDFAKVKAYFPKRGANSIEPCFSTAGYKELYPLYPKDFVRDSTLPSESYNLHGLEPESEVATPGLVIRLQGVEPLCK